MHNNLDLGVSQRGGIAIVTEKRRRTSNIMIARLYSSPLCLWGVSKKDTGVVDLLAFAFVCLIVFGFLF